jgi:hypothetical protein
MPTPPPPDARDVSPHDDPIMGERPSREYMFLSAAHDMSWNGTAPTAVARRRSATRLVYNCAVASSIAIRSIRENEVRSHRWQVRPYLEWYGHGNSDLSGEGRPLHRSRWRRGRRSNGRRTTPAGTSVVRAARVPERKHGGAVLGDIWTARCRQDCETAGHFGSDPWFE